ncbi:ABC transporter permease [Streptomyces acidiscabies]|uniref:ABC transporter permease n=1 Tax=Streptomyces acidiscabies TaxID=42234 RepID=A0AAP6EDI5_9ACTN|nr:ABC transporter permease [Streptomyces acidiscabies]MBP5941353.1 ABC transporter permease [Streptomyces sp. LBUM 1476]MBZ3912706.1 ABC transporter permease [Streptomyces acidiscabies]MDX2958190.1 ABC transporter permease [Streptomyces acidiscabies]MDX3018557.1 ABC transporter permease [Streptomyces acidiscabies]MDX3791140.1 ABC transporter permease [Streptomyces acidiscabies]
MILYVVRRLGTGLVLAVLVTLLTFLLLSTSFDDVASSIVGTGATPDQIHQQKAQLGLDRPLFVQYGDWLGHAVRGDLGLSWFTSEPVRAAVTARLGVTLSLVVTALLLTTLISVTLGVLAAARGGAVDRIAQGVSMVGHLVPNLLIAIALTYVLAVKLGWFPATGYTPLAEDPAGWASTIAIPVAALMMGGVANLTAQIRGAMIGELRKDYVRTLRTRGVPTRSVVLRHALRGAAGPALTVLSLEFVQMLGGALVIEQVFALPGYGQYAFNASLQGDVPIIMGISLFGVLLVIGVNLAVDLVGGWLNPKARVLS